MKQYILVLLVAVIVTQTPYFLGIRDLSQTIVDFILAIVVFIPLGMWLGKKLRSREWKNVIVT